MVVAWSRIVSIACAKLLSGCLQYRNFLCSEHQNHRNLYTKVPRYPQVSVSFVPQGSADQHNKDPGCYKHSENIFPFPSVIVISVILWHGSFPLLEILVTVVFQICDRE